MRDFPADRLLLEVDERGFIIGESIIGIDLLTDSVGSWTDILSVPANRIASIELEMVTNLDNRVFPRPESPNMSVVLKSPDRIDNMYNKSIRLRYNHPTLGIKQLFIGRVDNTDTQIFREGGKKFYQVTLQCVSSLTTILLNQTLTNFTAPQEPVVDRVARINTIMGLSVDCTIDPSIDIAACTSVNISVYDALMECAIAGSGIFATYTDGSIVVQATTPDDSEGYAFSDVPGEGYKFANLNMVYGDDDIVSSVTAVAKSNSAVFRTKTIDGASAINAETITVDVPANSISLDAWLASFPFKYAVTLVPKSADVIFDDDLIVVTPIQPSTLFFEDKVYDLAIKAIRHSISGDGRWRIRIEWMDRNITTHVTIPPNFIKPSPPRNFDIDATNSHGSLIDLVLNWTAPSSPGSLTGYEIRYSTTGTTPTKTTGTLLANVGKNTKTITHANRSVPLDYTYSIFATTDDPTVYSDRATASIAVVN